MKVKIYSTPACPFCIKAKDFFKENNIAYEDLNVAEDEKARDEMIEKSDQMSVPVIEIGDTILVGFEKEKIQKALEDEK